MSRDEERDPRECGPDEEPCGSPDCGRCLPVCNTCGGDHLTEDHAREARYPDPDWFAAFTSRLTTGTVEDWRRAGAL